MKIGIDARFLTHPQVGGFKTYTSNLIGALAGEDRDNTYVLYVDRRPVATDPIPVAPNVSVRVVQTQMPLGDLVWREQVTLR